MKSFPGAFGQASGWRRRGDPRRRRLEVEVKEKKEDLVDDAPQRDRARPSRKACCRAAASALLRSIKALENLKVENPDQKTGIDIVRKALPSRRRPGRSSTIPATTARLSSAS